MSERARIDVLNGPGTGVAPASLERWCSRWSEELGADLRPVDCPRLEHLRAAVGADGAHGAVLSVGDPGDPVYVEIAGAARVPVAWVDLAASERPRAQHLDDPAAIAVRGRGILGFRWAAMWLLQRAASPCAHVAYGPLPDQVGDLRLPEDAAGPMPVVVLLHGGFWRERWLRDTIEPLAIDLAARGFATWNLEYRRVGPSGGGWPATFEDVAAGVDHLRELAESHPLDLERVVFIGHSAGGQLALWAVRRRGLDGDAAVRPALVVSLAGINDLVECARRGLGDTGNAAAGLMRADGRDADAYAYACPTRALPHRVSQLVVQGEDDNIADLIDMSVAYAEAARRAGDDVRLILRPGADHFDLIDPASLVWRDVARHIADVVGGGR